MSTSQGQGQSPIEQAIAQKAMQQANGLFPQNYTGTNFAKDFGLSSDEQAMIGTVIDRAVQFPTGTDAQLFDQMDTGYDFSRMSPQEFALLKSQGKI